MKKFLFFLVALASVFFFTATAAEAACDLSALNGLRVDVPDSPACGGAGADGQIWQNSVVINTSGCFGDLTVTATGNTNRESDYPADTIELNGALLFTNVDNEAGCAMQLHTGSNATPIKLNGEPTTTFTLYYKNTDAIDGNFRVGAYAQITNVLFKSNKVDADCSATVAGGSQSIDCSAGSGFLEVPYGQDVSLKVTPKGGVSPYTYAWDGEDGGTTPTVTCSSGDTTTDTCGVPSWILAVALDHSRVVEIDDSTTPTPQISYKTLNLYVCGDGKLAPHPYEICDPGQPDASPAVAGMKGDCDDPKFCEINTCNACNPPLDIDSSNYCSVNGTQTFCAKNSTVALTQQQVTGQDTNISLSVSPTGGCSSSCSYNYSWTDNGNPIGSSQSLNIPKNGLSYGSHTVKATIRSAHDNDKMTVDFTFDYNPLSCSDFCDSLGDIGQCSPNLPVVMGSSPFAGGNPVNNAIAEGNKTDVPKNAQTFLGSLASIFGMGGQPATAGPANCSDYYLLGNVKIGDVSISPWDNLKAGFPVDFSVAVTNSAKYPVADGILFAKIYRLDLSKKDPNASNFLVDVVPASTNVNLWPDETKTLNFKWTPPENLISGAYEADFTFSSSRQYSLAGLVFTPTIFGARASFNLAGQDKGFWFNTEGILFNRNKILLSEWIPTIKNNEDVDISLPLESSLSTGTADVSLDLFYFDLQKDSPIAGFHQEKKISLSKGEQMVFFGTLKGIPAGAYVVKITASGMGQQSIIDLRFAKQGFRPRINFSGLTDIPRSAGDKFSIFTCYSNSADYINSANSRVNAYLLDKQTNELLASLDYASDIAPTVQAVKQDFTLNKQPPEEMLLVSRVYDDKNNVLEEVKTDYNLADFSPRPKESAAIDWNIFLWGTGLAVVAVGAGAVWYFLSKNRRKK